MTAREMAESLRAGREAREREEALRAHEAKMRERVLASSVLVGVIDNDPKPIGAETIEAALREVEKQEAREFYGRRSNGVQFYR